MKIFVPGRICLLGEHSDWAGGYRRTNADVEKGYAILAGTNQGIYATVQPHPSALVLHSTTPDGARPPEIVVAVNGTVGGTIGGFVPAEGGWRFASVLGPFLRTGSNDIQAFEVVGAVLRPLD